MDFRIGAAILALFALNSLAAPVYDAAKATNSRRDLQQFLKKTAEAAESLSKTALKYIIPEVEQSGATVLKPFLKKRGAKRSVAVQGPQTSSYNWPYYNQMYQQRSEIAYPGYMYPSYYQWNGNPYWKTPYQRSAIPYAQLYYQQTQPSTSVQSRTLSTNEAADYTNTKESLKNFQNLISNVDSALLSFSDKSGVALSESLEGTEKDSTKRKKVEKLKKQSKLTKKQAKAELKKISKTFTNFICGDLC